VSCLEKSFGLVWGLGFGLLAFSRVGFFFSYLMSFFSSLGLSVCLSVCLAVSLSLSGIEAGGFDQEIDMPRGCNVRFCSMFSLDISALHKQYGRSTASSGKVTKSLID
jgi:hypothetical protein